MKRAVVLFSLVLLCGLSALPFSAWAQLKVYSFEQIDSLQKAAPKPVVVFIHTNWCRYCNAMKGTTLKNKQLIESINERYYFADLDAEEKRNIQFNGYQFQYKPTGNNTGIHQLAEALGTINNKLAYPSIYFLNTKHEIIYQREGYINAETFMTLLRSLAN